jgi:hypothetical protein
VSGRAGRTRRTPKLPIGRLRFHLRWPRRRLATGATRPARSLVWADGGRASTRQHRAGQQQTSRTTGNKLILSHLSAKQTISACVSAVVAASERRKTTTDQDGDTAAAEAADEP